MCYCLSLTLQSVKEESLQKLTEEKTNQDTQLAALGKNLASVRQQLEGERRRGQEMERRGKSQEIRIEGGPSVLIMQRVMMGCVCVCVLELTLKTKTLQDEHRALLEK